MEFRHSVRESIEESGDPGKKKKTHAERSYGRFFEGYTTELSPRRSRSGKIRKPAARYVYVGSTYAQKLSERDRIRVRILYAAAWLSAAVLFCFAATRPVTSNMTWYVTIFEAGALLGLGWMFIALAAYIFAPLKMKAYTYKGMIRFHFRISMKVAFVSLAAASIGTLLNMIIMSSGTGSQLAVLICMSACTAFTGAICAVEDRIEYYEIKGKDSYE